MNRIEFLERLEELLLDVPYTERREALNYYTEYFEDAEKEDEEVIRTLGSPEEVAHNIREELAGKELTVTMEDTKHGFCAGKDIETGQEAAAEHFCSAGSDACDNGAAANYDSAKATEEKTALEGWQIALIIVAAVVTIPVWGGAISAAAGVILGAIATFFGIILALAATALACFIAAVAVFVVAVIKIVVSPVASFFLIGLSVLLLGISMLCFIGSWKSITVLTPAIWRGLVSIWNSIFRKKEGVTA